MKRSKWTCKACSKTSYPSESRAMSAVRTIEELFGEDNHPIPTRAYICPYGNGFHLSSKEARVYNEGSNNVVYGTFTRWEPNVYSGEL